MQIVIDLRLKEGTIQGQIVSQLHDLIVRGVLAPGMQMPSSRELAGQLGVARRTVVLSYERLCDDGYLIAKAASGTFVCRELPTNRVRVDYLPGSMETVPRFAKEIHISELGMNLHQPVLERLPYDFRVGSPDQKLFPRKTWRRLISESFETFCNVVTDYPDPAGHPLLRQAIAKHLRAARGISCAPEQIIVTAGTQEGLSFVSRLLATSRKRVVIEDPCYLGAANAFLSHDSELYPVAVSGDGIDTDLLPDDGAALAFVTPSHQFPLGVTMSLERRQHLINWARRTGTFIVEDDYDSDFRHNSSPLMALQARGPECVIYLGTFSKSIGPGLRLGYAVVPTALLAQAHRVKSVMNNGHPWMDQAVTAQFISSGSFERHLVRMRTCYVQRRDLLMRLLTSRFPNSSFSGYEGGMHLIWEPGDGSPQSSRLQAAARRFGVGIYTLSQGPAYRASRGAIDECIVMLGYPALDEDRISRGVERLQQAAKVAID